MDQFKDEVVTTIDTARNAEIDLTRLRYECSHLFHAMRTQSANNVNLATFRAALEDPFLAGNPVTDMLRAELTSLEAAQEHLRRGMSNYIYAHLAQHEVFTSTGGGTAGGILPPTYGGGMETDPVAPCLSTIQTPMSGATQQRIAQMMRTASQTPNVL